MNCAQPRPTGDEGPSLGIVALVTHARQVPSEARERFGDEAAALGDDPRVILLRTCHRVELYVAVDEPGETGRPVVLPELPAGGRMLRDAEAVRHLLTVAAGLDSIVIGEDQILHQLRDCLSERQLAGFDGSAVECAHGHRASLPDAIPGELEPILDRLFQLALHVGRQSRAWREGPPRSLSDVAIERIEHESGGVHGRPVLVVGAGRMGRLAALSAARRGARVIVMNRSHERAAALAADAAGEVARWAPDSLPEAAGIVVAIAGRWDLDEPTSRLLAERRPTVVDLSSPPALAPAERTALGSRFVSVDDLARGPEDGVRDRQRRRIERLLEEANREFSHWVHGRQAVPAIQALTEQAETRRAAEVEKLLRRMPNLEDHDRALVEQMSRRLVASLLHAPLTTLRDDQSGDRERAARELFAL